MRLRGGHETTDPRLDRVPFFDPRSRAYPIAEVVPETLRSRSWPCRPRLDQGREGACVGFAWSHELAATPKVVGVDNDYAQRLYREAQTVDEWAGESYEGSSVLAGAKVVQSRGLIESYRWSFGIDDLLRALSHAGPVVIGIPWLYGMYYPRPSGLVDVHGGEVGGHALLTRGVILSGKVSGEPRQPVPLVRCRNSWGVEWGRDGDFFIRADDLERLLKQGGEGCVPLGRGR